MVQQASEIITRSSSESLLEQIAGRAGKTIARIEQAAPQENLDTRLAEMDRKLDEALRLQDEKGRQDALNVLTADFESLRQITEKSEKDFAQVVLDLHVESEALDKEYAKLQKPNDSEQGILTRAATRLQTAKDKLTSVETRRLIWNRSKAIADAQLEIVNAENGVQDATSQVKQLIYDRLSKADFASSIQSLHRMGREAIAKMTARTDGIKKDIDAIRVQLAQTLKTKEGAAKLLDEKTVELANKGREVEEAEQLLTTLGNGTQAYAEQETKVTTLRREEAEIRGQRNDALVLLQSKDSGAKSLANGEQTQMKLLATHQAWITMLTSDQEDREVVAATRLDVMKSMADQEIAESLNKVAKEFDMKSNAEMAAAGAAAERRLASVLEEQPGYAKRVHQILTASAHASAETRNRVEFAIRQYQERYGIDVYEESTSAHGAKPEQVGA